MKILLLLLGLLAVVLGQHSHFYSYEPQNVRQAFNVVDINHDDSVTRDEVLQHTKQGDLNGDGFVSYTEYKLTKASTTPTPIVEGEFRYYDQLDGVNDGNISDSGADGMMNILDSNKDGRVTLDEFRHNMAQVLDGLFIEIYGYPLG